MMIIILAVLFLFFPIFAAAAAYAHQEMVPNETEIHENVTNSTSAISLYEFFNKFAENQENE